MDEQQMHYTGKLPLVLEPLRTHIDPTKPNLPGYDGGFACGGRKSGLRFIITVDYDGQIEASFSIGPDGSPRQPRAGQCARFLQEWCEAAGLSLYDTKGKRCKATRHYVVLRGLAH